MSKGSLDKTTLQMQSVLRNALSDLVIEQMSWHTCTQTYVAEVTAQLNYMVYCVVPTIHLDHTV